MPRTTISGGKFGQTRLILIGAAVLLSLGMGMRQSLGLFLTPVTRDLALTAAEFTLAVAIQNIVWGISQAPIGAIADRFGLRAFCKGLHPDVEQHLQQPAFRGHLARQVAADRC
jgi:MFS family permease